MNILGFHGGPRRDDEEFRSGYANHDGAAVVFSGGKLVAAIEEERLDRIKHSNCFPVRAIQRCLDEAGLSFDSLDYIAVNRGREHMDRRVRFSFLYDPAAKPLRDGESVLSELFRSAFNIDVKARYFFCPHHMAHAWSAYVPSGFDESLVLVTDGDGEDSSGMVLVAEGKTMVKLRTFSLAQSLGNLYEMVIKIIGYGRFDEYKVMGLAPYGDPSVFDRLFLECYSLLPNGEFRLAPFEHWFATFDSAGVLAHARRKGGPITEWHKHLAAALQSTLERIILHVLKYFRAETGKANLCLAGGVAHNCSANGAVLYSRLFEDIFVQPAAHDAGGAVGAALACQYEIGVPGANPKWNHVYVGTKAGDRQSICRELNKWSSFVDAEEVSGGHRAVAERIAQGAVIGWMNGRSEFGPRALGNRSILADPRPPGNKERINSIVKKRESFRPFAPAVLAERVTDYFEIPNGKTDFPFMLFVLRVRPEIQSLLGAVTHVDGTARVQTVSKEANPAFWELIREFEKITGVAVLLNTSFNNNAEPIVDSVDDALACFLTTGLDCLVIEDWLIRRRSPALTPDLICGLRVSLAPSRRLVMSKRRNADSGDLETAYSVESTRSRYFVADRRISAAMYDLLRSSEATDCLGSLLASSGVTALDGEELLDEVATLWSERVIALRP